VNITGLDTSLSLFQLSADDDLFQDFVFLAYPSSAHVLTMQEIFVQEKGAEALRTTNITYLHNQRREEPNMERKGVRLRNAGEIDEREYTQEEEDDHVEDNNNNKASKKDTSKGKVKKSLKVDKEIKVTTTIVKQKSN
jgi:hypothetical protein